MSTSRNVSINLLRPDQHRRRRALGTAHDRFLLQGVAPGSTAKDVSVIGSKDMGPAPQIPKIYVDQVTPLIDRG